MIDLQQFCLSDEDGRFYDELCAPFTVGAHTYAANGVIMVRVSARDGCDCGSEWHERAIQRYAAHFSGGRAEHGIVVEDEFFEPAIADEPCPSCDGDDLYCDYCDGDGIVAFGRPDRTRVKIGGTWFDKKYIDQISALPNVKISHSGAALGETGHPMHFAFDGGEGLLMPMNEPVRSQAAA